jgi:hypothetical protein
VQYPAKQSTNNPNSRKTPANKIKKRKKRKRKKKNG